MAFDSITDKQTAILRQVAENNAAKREGREPRKITHNSQVAEAVKKSNQRKDLEYPLNNPEDYKARLVFSVYEEEPTDLDGLLGYAGKKIRDFFDDEEDTTNEEKQVKLDQHKGLYNETVRGKGTGGNLGRKVSLYLPVALQYRDNVAYENMDIGAMGAAAQKGIQSGGGIASSIIEGGAQTFAAGLFGSANKELAKLGTLKLASMALPQEIQGALKVASGVTTNPNTRVLFKQVTLREFSFTFKFIATSQREAQEVNEIIKFFRTELYPEDITVPVGNSVISVGYKFPNKFNVEVLYNNERLTAAPKMEKMFLRDVSVTYNPTNQSMHYDGEFTEVDMTLSFQETRTLSRKDIEFGGF